MVGAVVANTSQEHPVNKTKSITCGMSGNHFFCSYQASDLYFSFLKKHRKIIEKSKYLIREQKNTKFKERH